MNKIKTMLSHIFPPSPCIELYNATSSDILKLWKMKGKITKEVEPYSKSPIHTLFIGGESIMSIPNKEKEFLQLQNSFLLFQFVLLNLKDFNIELNLRDKKQNKTKIFITTNRTEKKMLGKIIINNYPQNIWTNLIIDVGSLFQQIYHNNHLKYIDSILITGNIKIRKIFSLKTKDEQLPKSMELGNQINVYNYFLYDYNLPLMRINLKINEQSNFLDMNTSPKKKGRILSPLKSDNRVDIYLMNDKTKKNIAFAKKIPDLARIKNEINYGLKVKPNGVGEIKNINKILGFNAIENIEEYNIINNNIIDTNMNIKNRGNSSRKNQRSLRKYNKNVDLISKKSKNKSINPTNKNKYNNNNSKKNLSNGTNNIKNSINRYEIMAEENNVKNYNDEINNAINNINKIVFQNNSKYNAGNNKKKIKEPKNISYEVNNQSQDKTNKNSLNKKPSYELRLSKIENDNNLKLPLIKSYKQENNITENNNKYTNFELLLDSTLINNSKLQAQLYDSIEEESCLINNINSTLIDGSKLDDKIIKIDPEFNKGNLFDNKNNKKEFIITNSDFPEISNLINDDTNNSNRPYTPPLSKLVPVNQSRNMGKKDDLGEEKIGEKTNKINPNNVSYIKPMKKTENLIYDEIKGCYFNPKTNVYYDIKNLM